MRSARAKTVVVAAAGAGALVCVAAVALSTMPIDSQFQSLQFSFGPMNFFPPIRGSGSSSSSSHGRTNSNPFFKMVPLGTHQNSTGGGGGGAFNPFGGMFGGGGGNGMPVVHETEIIERPDKNGNMVEKKYVYNNGKRVKSDSKVVPVKKLTPAEKAKEKKEEKQEIKQEQHMAKDMSKITKNIFSNFFGGGGARNQGRSRVEWIPIGRIKPVRQWRTTERRPVDNKVPKTARSVDHAPNDPAPPLKKSPPKAVAAKKSPPKAPPAPKGPVVKHGVVNGLAASGVTRQQLDSIDTA